MPQVARVSVRSDPGTVYQQNTAVSVLRAPWGMWMVMPVETRRRCRALSPPFSSTMPKSICGCTAVS